MIRHIGVLVSYSDLLFAWAQREVRIRYKQAAIGGLWAILQPLALMMVFTVVFSRFAQIPTDGIPYPIFSYTALLPWTFFATSLTFAIPSLVNNMNLVTKIYFPREVLPIASVGAALVDFVVASTIFVFMFLIYGISVHLTLLWIPLLLLIQLVLTLGVVLLLSSANVFYRDIRFVVPILTQLWMYASPIIYPTTLVPEKLRGIYMLNPMAGLIDAYRRVILLGQPPVPLYLTMSAVISLVTLVVGYAYFKHSEKVFADMI